MAQGWCDHDWVDMMIEIEELKQRKLKPGAKVFDIGAHQGVVVLLLSRAIGPDGVVVAVEADPWNARAAEINRKLNKAANVRVLHAAAGETDTMPDHKPREGLDRVFDWSQKEVGFLCLDTLAKQHGFPEVVYVDVDGFETAVLRGAAPFWPVMPTGLLRFMWGAAWRTRGVLAGGSCLFSCGEVLASHSFGQAGRFCSFL